MDSIDSDLADNDMEMGSFLHSLASLNTNRYKEVYDPYLNYEELELILYRIKISYNIFTD